MKQLSISELKKLKVSELREIIPCEITSDGTVIGVLKREDAELQTGRTKCPNCKFEYDLPKQDNTPSFFSVKH